MSVVEITTENFDTEVLQADKPVLSARSMWMSRQLWLQNIKS